METFYIKKIKNTFRELLFILIIIFGIVENIKAQAPQKLSYQAVIRNNTNQLVVNQIIGMKISVIQTSPNGNVVYAETQNQSTNTNGLVTVEIGNGNVQIGNFSTIDWADGPYYIKTETDPIGGNSYSITGTTQILSVPYALHSKTAENVVGPINETDPIFNNSVAAGITPVDIANWNNDLVNDADNNPTNELQTLSVNGNQITISNGNTISLPNKIIRGTIAGGFGPIILSGSGFTITHTSTGTYTITFSNPFVSVPSATVSLFNTSFADCNAIVNSLSTTQMVIKTGKGDGNTSYTLLNNLDFSFIVVE